MEPSAPLELWYTKPATRWMEALPLGNGRIGAMVYGGPGDGRLDLTESTIWSGAPSDANIRDGAHESLGRIRELMFAGKYAEGGDFAKSICWASLSLSERICRWQLSRCVLMEIRSQSNIGGSLNLDEGIASVDYTRGGVRFKREVFARIPQVYSSHE
jgi:alpha-L-fucosidase 2